MIDTISIILLAAATFFLGYHLGCKKYSHWFEYTIELEEEDDG